MKITMKALFSLAIANAVVAAHAVEREYPGNLKANIAALREGKQPHRRTTSIRGQARSASGSLSGFVRRSLRNLVGCALETVCICDESGLRKAINSQQMTSTLYEDNSNFKFFCDGATIEISEPIDISGKFFELAADYSAFGRPKPGVTLKPTSGSNHQLFVGGPDNFSFGLFGAIIEGFSGDNGGAVSLKGGYAYFTGCEFTNNKATGNGGAVYLADGASAYSQYTKYSGNKAGGHGQEVYVDARTDEIEACPTPSPTNSPQPTIHHTSYPTVDYSKYTMYPTIKYTMYPTQAPVPTDSPRPTPDYLSFPTYPTFAPLCSYTSYSCSEDKYCGDNPKDAFAQAVNATKYGDLIQCSADTSAVPKNSTDKCVPVNYYPYQYPDLIPAPIAP